MRACEIFSLKWEDVDLTNRKISIKAMNTKTMKAREVPITSRLAAVFRELREKEFPLPDKLIFGITDNIKKSWRSVCKRAGVVGLKIHDLRHTAATRLIQGGLPQAEVARILGHSSISMTFRYVNADDTTVLRAGEILDRMNSN
jgi:integrase